MSNPPAPGQNFYDASAQEPPPPLACAIAKFARRGLNWLFFRAGQGPATCFYEENIFTRKELIEIFREIHSLHSAVSSAEFFQGWDKAVGACEEEFTQKTGITVSDLCEEAGSVNDPVNHPSHYCDGFVSACRV